MPFESNQKETTMAFPRNAGNAVLSRADRMRAVPVETGTGALSFEENLDSGSTGGTTCCDTISLPDRSPYIR
jgi:hypothetical protein